MVNLAIYFLRVTSLLFQVSLVYAWEPLETCHLPENLVSIQGWGFRFVDPPYPSSSDMSRSLYSLVYGMAWDDDSTPFTGALNFDFTIMSDDPSFSEEDGLDFMEQNLHTTSLAIIAHTNFKPKISGEYTFTIETAGGAAELHFQTLPAALCCENLYQYQNTQIANDGLQIMKTISSDGLPKSSSITVNLEAGQFYSVALFYLNIRGDANLKVTVTLPTGETITDFSRITGYMGAWEDYICEDIVTTAWDYSPWSQTYNSTYSTSTTSEFRWSPNMHMVKTVYYVYTSTDPRSILTSSDMPLSSASSGTSYYSSTISSATPLASTTALSETKSDFSSTSKDAMALSSSDTSATVSLQNPIDTVTQRPDSPDAVDFTSTTVVANPDNSAVPIGSDNLDGIGRSKDGFVTLTRTKTHITTNPDSKEILGSKVTQNVDAKTEKSDIPDVTGISSTGGFRNDTEAGITLKTAKNEETSSQTNSKVTLQATTGGYGTEILDNTNGIDVDAKTGVSRTSLLSGNVAGDGIGSDENLQDAQSGLQTATPSSTNVNNNIPDNINNAGHSVSKSPEHFTNVVSEPWNNGVQEGSGAALAETGDVNNIPNSVTDTGVSPQNPGNLQSIRPADISLEPYGTDLNGMDAVESIHASAGNRIDETEASQVSAINIQSPTVVVSAVPNIAGRLNTVLSVACAWMLLILLAA